MKKNLIILLISITTTLFSQQSGVVEYEFFYKNFTDPPKDRTIEQARRTADMSAEYAKDHKYILKFNPTESLYYIENSMPIDEIDSEFAYKFSKSIFSNGIFYQSKKSNESLNQLTTMNEFYLIKDSMPDNWKITSEQKNIGKYKCFKAVSSCDGCNKNQIITVWFTPEIPVPFGPGGYWGTPGLILEVSKYRYTLRVKKIKLSDKNMTIKKPVDGVLISSEKLKELQWEKRREIKKRRS